MSKTKHKPKVYGLFRIRTGCTCGWKADKPINVYNEDFSSQFDLWYKHFQSTPEWQNLA